MRLLLAALLLCLCAPNTAHSAAQDERYSLIAFESDRDGNPEIYVMYPDGSNPVRLTFDPEFDVDPVWSPDGRHIAFQSFRDGDSEIFVLSLGGVLDNVTDNDELDLTPTWSPDSRRIAFTSGRDGEYEIYVIDADGRNPVQLTDNDNLDDSPVWSPDGEHIVFESNRDGQYDLYMMNADGSNVIRLTYNESFESRPVWSPDSPIIISTVWDDTHDPQPVQIHTESMEIAAYEPISNILRGIDAFSPDGNFVLYTVNMPDTEAGTGNEIFIQDMSVPDAQPVQLTQNHVLDNAGDWSPWMEGPALWLIPFHDTPTEMTCPNAPPSQLNIGMRAYVPLLSSESIRRSLRVRVEPEGEQINTLEPGAEFLITGESVCGGDGLIWWPITTLDGTISGWSVEGFAPDDYLMTPYAGS